MQIKCPNCGFTGSGDMWLAELIKRPPGVTCFICPKCGSPRCLFADTVDNATMEQVMIQVIEDYTKKWGQEARRRKEGGG